MIVIDYENCLLLVAVRTETHRWSCVVLCGLWNMLQLKKYFSLSNQHKELLFRLYYCLYLLLLSVIRKVCRIKKRQKQCYLQQHFEAAHAFPSSPILNPVNKH